MTSIYTFFFLVACVMHDPTQWHPLTVQQGNPDCPCEPSEPCSFNHEHGDAATGIAAFEGKWPAIPVGPEAHQLWKYHVRRDISPQGEGNLYVRNLIALEHVGGTNQAMEVQLHGSVIWAEICDKDAGQCGVLKRRALTDFGCLQVLTDAGQFDSPFGGCNGNRRLHFRLESAPWLNGRFTWYGNDGAIQDNQFIFAVGSAISGNDAWAGRDPANWDEWLWNCSEFAYCTARGCQPDPSSVDASGCGWNDSNRGIESMLFTVSVSDAAGFVNPFTGQVDPSCLSETEMCFPFELIGVPTGFAAYRPGDQVEYDTFEGLIGFPN